MDYEEINDHMTEQQKSSLRAAVLQQMAGTTMTYDEINNCLSEQQKTSLMTAALQTMVEDASGVPQEYTNYDDVNNQLSEQQKSSLMAAALMYLKDNGGGGDCGEGIGFGEGTCVKGITSDVDVDGTLTIDFSQTTTLKQLFAGNSSQGFKNITISNVDLSGITDCTRMFETCVYLENVTFDNTTPPGWSPIAPNMFYNCVGLKKVILPQGFSPTSIQSFLSRCSALTEFPQFDTSNATNIAQAFENVSPHGTLKPPVYDFSRATVIFNCFGNFGRNYDPFFDGDISANVENILLSMLTMTSFTGTKRFSEVFAYTPSSTGTSSLIEMYNIITASPTYQLLLNAGWAALS